MIYIYNLRFTLLESIIYNFNLLLSHILFPWHFYRHSLVLHVQFCALCFCSHVYRSFLVKTFLFVAHRGLLKIYFCKLQISFYCKTLKGGLS